MKVESEPSVGAPITKRTRLSDHIVERLSRLIVEGALAPGTAIKTESLARQLGVSRTPMREALQRLELDGLVIVSPSGTARVASYGSDEALELMDLREIVDGLAARVLAERGAPRDVMAQLAELVEEGRQASLADDKHRFLVVNARFHTLILEATNHHPLQQFHALVRLTSQAVYVRLGHQQARHKESAREHRDILRAITARDPVAAERAARSHVKVAADFWLRRGPKARG